MKPEYIKMSAFGSYAGEETICFTDVNHGIFLITGDTGAGKTTIFDAITYALYDSTSGGKRNGEMMRSQFAGEDCRTYVELKFIYHGETYIINRAPRQNRISKKKNKEGNYTITVDQPSVELIMPDGLPFVGKLKETNQKIVDIVGLDINQFTQIAMIAQGDFLKLLHAPSKERKEIFAKIFNTRIYWRIEEELKSRAKAMYGKLEDNRKDLIREMEDVQCIEDSDIKKQWEGTPRFLESEPDKLLDLLTDIIKESKRKEEDVNQELQKLQESLDQIISEIKLAEETNQVFASLERSEHKKAELDRKKDSMSEMMRRIEAAKRAIQIEAKENAFLEKQKAISECSLRIGEIKAWLEEHGDELIIRKKTKDESESEYKRKNPQISSKISRIQELIPKYEILEVKLSERNTNAKRKAEIEKKQGEIILQRKNSKEKEENILKNQQELKECSDQYHKLVPSVERLTERTAALEGLIRFVEELDKQKISFENAEKELQSLENRRKEKSLAYEELYHRFINGQAGMLSATLEEGRPCPVCGSTAHPHKAASFEAAISQKELQEGKQEAEHTLKEQQDQFEKVQQLKLVYENAKGLAKHEGKRLLDSAFHVETVSQDELQQLLKECKLILEAETKKKLESERSRIKYETNEVELKNLNETMKTYDAEKEITDQLLQEMMIKLTAIDTEIKTLREALIFENKETAQSELAAAGEQLQNLETLVNDSAKRYQALLGQITEKQGNLKAEEDSHYRMTEERNKAEELYLREVTLQGFADVEEYHAYQLASEKIEELSYIYQEYREEVIENEVNRKHYIEQTKGKSKIQTERMEEEKTKLETDKTQRNEESKTIYGIRSRNETIYAKSVKLIEERKKVRDEYTMISRLDATANGRLSQRHMNFQTYIQRRYFKSILYEANKRLYTMSNNQFILKCKDMEELSGQGEVGLDLDVYSMVNDQTRDVKTLSGGESFMAALAMALGMADIIQNTAGSIHIDTMFIDEGFGSLSDETRTQAITILNELSEGKRLIGIISHVTELKAQIGTKLVITKSEKGSKARWEIYE